jgi:hypothetical protein
MIEIKTLSKKNIIHTKIKKLRLFSAKKLYLLFSYTSNVNLIK